MQFNSYTFIIFFALVLATYRLPLSWRVKKINLLWASYLFYAAWNPPFVLLLWFSTLLDWYSARWIHRAIKPSRRKTLLILSLIGNLGLLGYFKYGKFLLANFTAFLSWLGVDYHPPTPNILLPVGISFYTFQTLSYTLDVYLRRSKPCQSFLDYALYVTFFPQLVAGPIVRAKDFLPQCEMPRNPNREQLGWGLCLMVLGLFEKVVLADGLLAPTVEGIYDGQMMPTLMSAWAGAMAFRGQIFCDFAGYSTCAIGAALCLGFILPVNFRCPLATFSLSETWQRWHISLSTWMKDYLFIPLGGSKRGRMRTFLNIMITMSLGGLWHGPAWTFVVWGAVNGAAMAVEVLLKQLIGHWRVWKLLPTRIALATFLCLLNTVMVVLFRAHDMHQAGQIIGSMLGLMSLPGPHWPASSCLKALGVMGGILAVQWIMRDREMKDLVKRLPWPVVSLALLGMILAILTMQGDDRAFIYFQF